MIKNLVFYLVEHPIPLISTSLIGFLVLGFCGWGRFKPLVMALLYGMVFAMIVPIIGILEENGNPVRDKRDLKK